MKNSIQRIGLAGVALAVALGGAALASCGTPSPDVAPRTSLVRWPERQLLLEGDSGSGTLRVFRLIGERPVPVAVWRAAGRDRVLDIRVDSARGGVWVLGDATLDLHAADGGRLLDRRAVAGRRLTAGPATGSNDSAPAAHGAPVVAAVR